MPGNSRTRHVSLTRRTLIIAILLLLLTAPVSPVAARPAKDAALSAAPDGGWSGGFNQHGFDNGATVMVADGKGNIYVGGAFTHVFGMEANRIVKWDGQRWSALGEGVTSWVRDMLIDGKGADGVMLETPAGGAGGGTLSAYNDQIVTPTGTHEWWYADQAGTALGMPVDGPATQQVDGSLSFNDASPTATPVSTRTVLAVMVMAVAGAGACTVPMVRTSPCPSSSNSSMARTTAG